MRNWKQFVREHLPPLGLSGAREAEIVEELALQLEQSYADAMARGATDLQAEAHAAGQIKDWAKLAAEIRRAETPAVQHAAIQATTRAAAHLPEPWQEALHEEQFRKRRGGNMVTDLFQDLHYAARTLRKSPGFTAIMILTLALGIGANATIFSVVDGVLLRPLPYPQPEQLVRVFESNPGKGWPTFALSPPNFLDWRAQTQTLAKIAAYEPDGFTYTSGDAPERWSGPMVTEGFFEVLGAQPELGRTFSADEFEVGKSHVAVLSDALWRSTFGADRSVLGRNVSLDGQAYTVIGVMGPQFQFPSRSTQIWLPRVFTPDEMQNGRGSHYLGDIARLAGGVSVAQAQAEMAGIAARLAKQYPRTNVGWTTVIIPLSQAGGVVQVRPALLVLLGTVGFVLLIACANAANMLLARASVRQREIAVRLALGATRGRLIRQLLTESVLLSFIGAALGLLIAFASARVITTLPPNFLPRAQYVRVDGVVLAFTAALGLLTGLVFGSLPAIAMVRGELNDALREGGRTGSGVRAGLRKLLVVAEVMLAFVLLAGAGLLVRSFSRLTAVDPGVKTAGRVAFDLNIPGKKYATPQQQLEFYDEVQQRLAALPGIESAVLTTLRPASGDDEMYSVGHLNDADSDDHPSALSSRVSPGYFQALGIPFLAGRDFTAADNGSAPHVCIINDVFARTMFPGSDPIGQKVHIGHQYVIAREIVGVVASVKQFGQSDDHALLEVYEPFAQFPRTSASFVLRSSGETAGLASSVRHVVGQVDSQQPVTEFMPLNEILGDLVALPRSRTVLLGIFSGLAALLAAIGLYGVMSYTVTQQTQEIGIRLALGAQRGNILRLVIGKGMLLVGAGVALGVAGAIGLARVLSSFTAFLFGVKPYDPLTLAAVALLFAGVAAVACWIPARRASRVDPLEALRYE
jgi:putative ABC transport system permease protein